MGLHESALLFVSALLGGGVNAIAGGGSFFTFPALVFTGTPPLAANATSTVALWPGSVASALGYRRALAGQGRLLVPLGVVSLVGGLVGALGVMKTPASTFVVVLPFLLLAATVLFTFGDRLRRAVERLGHPPLAVVAATQLVIAVYGGYFGGGMGLLMLAVFALLGPEDLTAMNALKSLLGVAINLTAWVAFAIGGYVEWLHAVVMVAGSVIGGFGVARLAQRVDTRKVRAAITVLAWAMTLAFFVRTFG